MQAVLNVTLLVGLQNVTSQIGPIHMTVLAPIVLHVMTLQRRTIQPMAPYVKAAMLDMKVLSLTIGQTRLMPTH